MTGRLRKELVVSKEADAGRKVREVSGSCTNTHLSQAHFLHITRVHFVRAHIAHLQACHTLARLKCL